MKVRIPSPAAIIASLALLLSLTGTAVAGALITGSQIKDNTVGSLDLTNNSVKGIDVKTETLTTSDILNGTLRAVDFAPGQLPAGAVGPAGPVGPQGPGGPQGAPGFAAVELVTQTSASNSNSVRWIDVSCPVGKQVVGGGGRIVNSDGDVALDESYPLNATTWRATAYEVVATGDNWYIVSYAICATVAS